MRLKIFIILIFSFLNREATSQINIMGKPGYINTPSAEWFDQKPLGFSFSYVPGDYSMFREENGDIYFYNARASITSFLEANLTIAFRPDKADLNQLGIGDRQFDFRIQILKESDIRPSILVGLSMPGSASPFMAHDYIVLTKTFPLSSSGSLQFSLGYNSPYVFTQSTYDKNHFWGSFKLEKKSELLGEDYYLPGIFGAVRYEPINNMGIMAEFDSNTINAGVFIQPLEWFILQGTTYEGKEFAFTAALNFSLDFLPHSLRRHEKAQD